VAAPGGREGEIRMRNAVMRVAAALAVLVGACAQGSELRATPEPEQETVEQETEEPTAPGEIAVTAVDYKFHGIPEALEAGEVTFVLQNEGEEKHELVMARLKGGKSTEEVLRLPGPQQERFIEPVPGRALARPGGSAELSAELGPGAYAYVCFIATPEGTPHAFEGMVGELTVD
jgi:uncharacterized cupredoxin-like copper-binding protein